MRKRLKHELLSVQFFYQLVLVVLFVTAGAMLPIGMHAFAFTLDAAEAEQGLIGAYGCLLEKYLPFHGEPSVRVLDSHAHAVESGFYTWRDYVIDAYRLREQHSESYVGDMGEPLSKLLFFFEDGFIPSNENNFQFSVIDRDGLKVGPNFTFSVVNECGNDVEKTVTHAAESSTLFFFGCGVVGLANWGRKRLLRVRKLAVVGSKKRRMRTT